MPLYLKSFKNNLPESLSKDFYIQGLDDFIKVVEKDFFGEVVVRKYASNNSEVKLVIELTCNLSILESLHNFNKGVWGGFQYVQSSLSRAIRNLRNQNQELIEIEEFSIFLKDTSIIINKIYANSIVQQFKRILIELGNHYVHLTKGLNEIPYEIYIPVFEERSFENENALTDIRVGNNNPKDYFSFWGLYFDSDDDAVIYDLENLCIVRGDLYMLNS